MIRFKIIFFCFSFLFVVIKGFSQDNLQTQAGTFIIQNYSPKEYRANPQIFGITQDERGILYFANQTGVLEYDGVSWRTITVGENEGKVLGIDTDTDGKILATIDGDFGVLENDSIGNLKYRSLKEEFGLKELNRITQIKKRGNQYFIKSRENIWVLERGALPIQIKAETEFEKLYVLKDDIIVFQKNLGLYRLIDKQLRKVKRGYIFANKEVVEILDYASKRLIVTAESGLYEITKDKGIMPLHLLEQFSVFSTTLLDDKLSIGTFSDGVVVINQDLKIVYQVGVEKGLIDATVRCQFQDSEGNLWLGTNVGISKVSINDPVLKYDKLTGIKSGIEAITKFNNTYYFTTQNGVYTLSDNQISRIDEIEKDCYGIRPFYYRNDSLLLIAELNSVLSLNTTGDLSVVEQGGPYDCKQNPLDSSELIVVHYNGISKVKYENGSFKEVKYIRDSIDSELFNFIVDDDGTIWIGTLSSNEYGIYKAEANVFSDSIPAFKHYGEKEGMPKGAAFLFKHEGVLFCTTDKGVYKFENERFEQYNGFGFDFSSGDYGVHRISKDSLGNIWMVIFDFDNNYKIGYSSLVNGNYVWNDLPLKRYSDEIIHAVYHEANNITWLGGPNGLLRYDQNIKKSYSEPFHTIIRSVKYGDIEYYKGNKSIEEEQIILSFKYSSNQPIAFSYASTSFIDEKKTEYSILLEGHDDNWSHWSKRTIKEYYLSEGVYTFKVKARNVYGVITEEAVYQFEVLPPWYRTSWAYVLYVFGFMFFVYLAIRLSLRRVRQQNIRLEGIVEERTKEVVVQKQDAEKQRDIAEHQKELVEEKNKEIMDSITYAKRLQDAILPPEKLVKKKLPNSFVYYKPKDIVAGDFYWMEEIKGGEVLFAAADCTGHGVPGAMVSVVCSNALDRTVKEFKITNPGKVLDKVTDLVIETFEKSEDEVRDGMDIALCKLKYSKDKLKATIEFSGANNPLWIVSPRKDIGISDSVNMDLNGLYFHEVKATKQPVGQYADRKLFENRVVELEKGDVFYLFTDGFADQFGGPREKKYKYKPFKRLLLSSFDKSMPEQMKVIDVEFNQWKGDFEQVDDVCIIGVRL